MDLDFSHFGLLIFGYLLIVGLPRNQPIDSSHRVAWLLVGLVFVAIAILWQRAHDWPGFFAPPAVLAMMLYAAMFALGLVLARITGILSHAYKRRRIEAKPLSRL